MGREKALSEKETDRGQKKRWNVCQIGKVLLSVMIFTTILSGKVRGEALASVATNSIINHIRPGNICISLTEEHFLPDTPAEPGAGIAKDPAVINTGLNPVRVFLEIAIPMREFQTSIEGGKTEKRMHEMFSFTADASWRLVGARESQGRMLYVYVYHQLLDPSGKTRPLFEEVKTASFLEGDLLASEVLHIGARAYAIQADAGETDEEALAMILQQERGQG